MAWILYYFPQASVPPWIGNDVYPSASPSLSSVLYSRSRVLKAARHFYVPQVTEHFLAACIYDVLVKLCLEDGSLAVINTNKKPLGL